MAKFEQKFQEIDAKNSTQINDLYQEYELIVSECHTEAENLKKQYQPQKTYQDLEKLRNNFFDSFNNITTDLSLNQSASPIDNYSSSVDQQYATYFTKNYYVIAMNIFAAVTMLVPSYRCHHTLFKFNMINILSLILFISNMILWYLPMSRLFMYLYGASYVAGVSIFIYLAYIWFTQRMTTCISMLKKIKKK